MPLSSAPFSPRRRFLLGVLPVSLLLSSTAVPALFAQENAPPQEAAPPAGEAFSFDILTEAMRARAAESFTSAAIELPPFMADMDYDAYRHIHFRPDQARWSDETSPFRMHAFHLGWLYNEPVHLYEVADGQAVPFSFTTADFDYRGDLADSVADDTQLPGVAGFRLNYPLNRPDLFDEVIAFVGASYFRALGRGNFYGLSARGLAINTGLSESEEFPRFSAFYLERPTPGARNVVVNAALESQSATGALRFDIRPGAETVIDVTARFFFRRDVEQIGIAPMTSMFLYAENNRARFDDFRPQVHDSNGLKILRNDGDVLWRALNNPPRLASSYFAETNPRAFGLFQRDRNFDDYQDAGAHYERRPSLLIEPLGDWGEGKVRLVEIPSDMETNDNIVAFWVPEQGVAAGDEREYRYRMRWGNLDADPSADLAYVLETRTGHGGVSGVENEPDLRKFVVDFKGGKLGRLPAETETPPEPVVSITGGEIVHTALAKIDGTDVWRLVIDVRFTGEQTIELVAHVAGFNQRLTETWLYQWMPTA
ncbi:glucan biosynthesis protein [Pelagibacterium xiamenense]|uniref:glucan biosynthesis protein n=1 Tax=Pelagibacterium xiamenense TaxID=2901140 RepID=UPI001E4EBEB4|nr:glucan biosynthesis protein G [Pelagibacterium xiamenense]MCD7059147.1 glucan biosynthesis protein G [Pelagibacterium xiamenense]